jgi:Ser/Thr protein kinase RdoA (MazF antagonist)
LAETLEASLEPEVRIHALLRERGARVPEVVYFEPLDESLQRSVLMTRAIAGGPLTEHCNGLALPEILHEAGRDLALINAVSVTGFGWIRRDQGVSQRLVAEHLSRQTWSLEYIDSVRSLERAGELSAAEVSGAVAAIERWVTWPSGEQECLAHGDFDVSHIFQHDGRYTGIIDFGEVRGADRLYDLAHFHLHDGETLHEFQLPHLLSGYREVLPLPPSGVQQIKLLAQVIGIRALARSLRHPPGADRAWLRDRLRTLLADGE